MKFRFSMEFLIVVFLFVSIMIISTYGSTKVKPFESKSSSLNMFPYKDGFTDYNESASVLTKEPMSTSIQNIKPNEESETPDRIQKLHWGKYGSEKPIDIMSTLPSNPSCLNVSGGLSNSKGYLCPTDDVKKLFKTRGGNSSGQPSQIGA